MCTCGTGYVPQDHPVTCVKCDPACPVCSGPTANDCVGLSPVAQFILTAQTLNANLPYLTQANSLICYRVRAIVSSAEASYARFLGGLNKDIQGNWHLTTAQCNLMLSADWDYVNLWLNQLFPSFTPPATATAAQLLTVYTVLRIWIYHFGSASLVYEPEWIAMRAGINSATLDWTKVLGWAGTSPGYSDGTNSYLFPPKLAAWLVLDSSDLSAFNAWTTVCDTANCSMKTQCCATPQFAKSACCGTN